MIKGLAITLTLALAIVLISGIPHELVHFYQYTMDPRVDDVEIIWFNVNEDNIFLSGPATKGIWNATYMEENNVTSKELQDEYDSEILYREFPAYAIQISVIIILLYIVFSRIDVTKKG